MSTEYEQLTAPFANVQKMPKTGFDYIPGEAVVSRLNEVLGWAGWSFEIVEHGYHMESDAVWVKGRLTVGVVVKEQFGGQTHNRKDGKIIDAGNDLKGAATDALKKCATLIGVALYLTEKDAPRQAPQRAPQAAEKPASAAPSFDEWCKSMGYTPEVVIATSQRMFENKEPRQLSKTEKQQLVVALEEAKKKEGAHA